MTTQWQEQKLLFTDYADKPETFMLNGSKLWFNPLKIEQASPTLNETIGYIQDAVKVLVNYWANAETLPENVEEYIYTKLTCYMVHPANALEIFQATFKKYWDQDLAEANLDDLSWLD